MRKIPDCLRSRLPHPPGGRNRHPQPPRRAHTNTTAATRRRCGDHRAAPGRVQQHRRGSPARYQRPDRSAHQCTPAAQPCRCDHPRGSRPHPRHQHRHPAPARHRPAPDRAAHQRRPAPPPARRDPGSCHLTRTQSPARPPPRAQWLPRSLTLSPLARNPWPHLVHRPGRQPPQSQRLKGFRPRHQHRHIFGFGASPYTRATRPDSAVYSPRRRRGAVASPREWPMWREWLLARALIPAVRRRRSASPAQVAHVAGVVAVRRPDPGQPARGRRARRRPGPPGLSGAAGSG
jgi:hypothetical protein